MPAIPYFPEEFPPHTPSRFHAAGVEEFTWAHLVHAAITVGRASWADVFQHGNYSVLEILWRVAMLRANLRDDGNRLAASAAYAHLDRSEKGAVSFFLGLCAAKVFAARLLDVFWLLHLDVYRSILDPTFSTAERPDFVGMDATGHWIVVEAKGRTRRAPKKLLEKAKQQTDSLSTVAGQAPVLCIGMAAYFASGRLCACIRDPVKPVPLDKIDPESLAQAYYAQLFDFLRQMAPAETTTDALVRLASQGVALPGLDVSVRVSEPVARWYLLREGSWDTILARRRRLGASRLAQFAELMRLEEPGRRTLLAEQEEKAKELQRVGLDQQLPTATTKSDPEDTESRTFTGGDEVTVDLGQLWTKRVMQLDHKERLG